MTEMIGGGHTVITPGSIGWTTTGVSTIVIGGSQTSKTVAANLKVLGANTEQSGSRKVVTKAELKRDIKGAMTTQVGGSLKCEAGGTAGFKSAASISVTVGGSLTVDGASVVFKVGGSQVSVGGGGVEIVASEITITGKSKQSSKSVHK